MGAAVPAEQAAYPASWLREHKFWPAVGRIDNVYGDRNLVCSCVGMEAHTAWPDEPTGSHVTDPSSTNVTGGSTLNVR